ncbi:MAG: CDP-alcohol phosphatidyltransferase family protein [bacterium]
MATQSENTGSDIRPSDFLQPANLLSLSRILLTPVIGYFLSQPDSQATLICVILLIIAAITDGLDGYVARRMNLTGRLGMILDPLADKIMAAALVILLIFFRDFPFWLAAAIVGRDLAILATGTLLLKGSATVTPSSLTGKYTFAAIAVLLGSYVIRFEFGQLLMTYLTVTLLSVSTIIYVGRFVDLKRGSPFKPFVDRPVYRIIRVALTLAVSAVFLYRLAGFLMNG